MLEHLSDSMSIFVIIDVITHHMLQVIGYKAGVPQIIMCGGFPMPGTSLRFGLLARLLIMMI